MRQLSLSKFIESSSCYITENMYIVILSKHSHIKRTRYSRQKFRYFTHTHLYKINLTGLYPSKLV